MVWGGIKYTIPNGKAKELVVSQRTLLPGVDVKYTLSEPPLSPCLRAFRLEIDVRSSNSTVGSGVSGRLEPVLAVWLGDSFGIYDPIRSILRIPSDY